MGARDLVESLGDGPLDELAGILSADAEWWVAGDPAKFPWAGSFIGPTGFLRFLAHLRGALEYQRFATIEVVDGGDSFVQIVDAAGIARATGRSFRSLIARSFTERGGKLVRVRSLYDTAAYERALF